MEKRDDTRRFVMSEGIEYVLVRCCDMGDGFGMMLLMMRVEVALGVTMGGVNVAWVFRCWSTMCPRCQTNEGEDSQRGPHHDGTSCLPRNEFANMGV